MSDYDDYPDPDPDWYEAEESRPPDPKTEEAKVALLDLFGSRPETVFYGRQLQVMFEKPFWHWVTVRALGQLTDEGRIATEILPLAGSVNVRFYWSKRNRYWKRQTQAMRKIILRFSEPGFGRALGQHGEMMFDAALPTVGFLPKARDVTSYNGRDWEETGHDLDRVFERDGVAYGTEVKNTLDYIERGELDAKLRMCAFLGLKPLFIMRYAPGEYIEKVRRAGGFTLLFKYQLYPHGYGEFAREVREALGIPVDCPKAIMEGTMKRLLNGHLKILARELASNSQRGGG
jgi:hypothetical protein